MQCKMNSKETLALFSFIFAVRETNKGWLSLLGIYVNRIGAQPYVYLIQCRNTETQHTPSTEPDSRSGG
jgi:hypothetical protein